MNSCATTCWMQKISLTPQKYLFDEINSEAHSEGPSMKTELSFSSTMKEYGNRWGSQMWMLCLPTLLSKAHYVQSRNLDPVVARRTRFPLIRWWRHFSVCGISQT